MRPRKRLISSSTSILSPPLQILSQILILQISFYILAAGLILFTALTAGRPFSPELVLGWRGVRGDTVAGWTLGLCWMLAGFLEYVGIFFSRSFLVRNPILSKPKPKPKITNPPFLRVRPPNPTQLYPPSFANPPPRPPPAGHDP